MKKRILLNIIVMSFVFLAIICIHSFVYADSEIMVSSSEELLNEITKLRNKEEGDNSLYKIILNRGTYNTNTCISIPSNICIDLNGNTINYSYSEGNPYAFYIYKSENVEITNGTILNGGIHCRESKKVKLSNLKFQDLHENAIYIVDSSIDELNTITCTNAMRGVYLKSSTGNDIENCNISNVSSEGIRLVSSHVGNIKNNKISDGKDVGIFLRGPTDVLDGSSAKNIENNTIINCKGDGIGIFHGSYCKEIVRNTLDTIGGNHNGNDGDYGILIDSMMKANTYCTRIAENTIKNVTYAGIAIYSGPGSSFSEIYQDTAYVEKNIENNRLINCGTFNHSDGWKKESKQGCVSGIYIDTHARVKGDICNNIIEKTGENGIYVHLASRVNSIYNNTIRDCKEFGIHVYQLSIVYANIYNNRIYNSGIDGIAVTKESKVLGNIKSNIIDNTKGNGIYVRTSNVNDILNNTLNNIKQVGICLNDKSSANNIKSNSINMNNAGDGFAVRIVSNSKYKSINNNTIKGKMIYGIRVVGVFNNNEIISNKIITENPSGKDFLGLYVEGNDKKTTKIKKNEITGNKTWYGIRIKKGRTDILDNTIKKSTYPIYVEKNNITVKVKGNKISKNINNLIRTQKQKVSISSAKITKLTAEKKSKVKLNYKTSKKADKYEIYQATSKTGEYKKIKTTNSTDYTTKGLKAKKKYFYKICGYVKDGKVTVYTDYSNIKSITTKK